MRRDDDEIKRRSIRRNAGFLLALRISSCRIVLKRADCPVPDEFNNICDEETCGRASEPLKLNIFSRTRFFIAGDNFFYSLIEFFPMLGDRIRII